MEIISKYFWIFIKNIYLYFTIIILGYALCITDASVDFNNIILVIGSVMMVLLYFSIQSSITHLNRNVESKIATVSFFCLIFLQIIYLVNIQGIADTDLSFIHEEAIAMLETKKIVSEEYFGIYPHQICHLIIIYYLFKFARFLHIQDLRMVGYIFNIMLIDGSILLTYLTVKLKSGRKSSLTVIPFFILSPVLYIYISFYYTDTFAMFCISACLYLFFSFTQFQNRISKLLCLFILTIISLLGIKVRATVGIAIIGIVIFAISNNCIRKFDKSSLKEIVYYGIVILISGIAFLGFYNFTEHKFVTFDYSESKFPPEHYIGMGVCDPNGGYNGSDVSEMKSITSYAEKRKTATAKIKERLQERTLDENIVFGTRKLRTTWSNGLVWNHRFTRICRKYTTLWNYMYGDKKIIFSHLTQIILCSIWFITILGHIGGGDNRNDLKNITQLILVGAMVFYLFWEGKARYMISFYSIIIILMNESLISLSEQIKKLPAIITPSIVTKNYIKIFTIIIFATGIFYYSKYVKTPIPIKYYSVNQNVENQSIILDNNAEIVQSIKGQYDINKIAVKIQKGDYHKKTELHMYLLDDQNHLITSTVKTIKADDYKKDRFTVWSFDQTIQAKNKNFSLVIRASIPDDSTPISLKCSGNPYNDFYENGYMTLNGQIQDGDLTMSIYNEIKKPFMTSGKYCVLILFMIMICFYIYYELHRNFREY